MARSANLDFFAAETDVQAVLDFLFSSTDVRVFESYSGFGAELREFRSTAELAAAFPVGRDPDGNGTILLELWSPAVMRDLFITRIPLNPVHCEGHTFRHRIDGGGLMQLQLGGACGRVVTKSHFGHQSQVRAEAWEVDDGVNWDALKTLSNRILYHVRKRLSTGKAGRMPVLPRAYQMAQSGYDLKLSITASEKYELEPDGSSDPTR